MYPSDISGPSRQCLPPAEPVTPAPLTPVQQQELAQRYAPILYFHPQEENFLQDPNTYIEQSTLRQERDFWGDKELHGLGEVPAHELADIGPDNKDADSQLFLDHQNEELGDGVRDGDLANSKNLYQYDPESNTITYHLFYSYNDGPPGLGDVQNHEGDWEKITVQLDDHYQPTAVRYSAHGGLNAERSWADTPKEDGRPVSYVGQGSHANFPETGSWETKAPGIDDSAKSGGVRFDLAGQPAVDVTTQDWYGGHVLWGERGSGQELGIGETTGPTGPSADKGPIVAGDADPSLQPNDEKPGFPFYGPYPPFVFPP